LLPWLAGCPSPRCPTKYRLRLSEWSCQSANDQPCPPGNP
jgi:hypothetical protein